MDRYKYVVNDEWRTDSTHHIETDASGNVNNVMYISSPFSMPAKHVRTGSAAVAIVINTYIYNNGTSLDG